MMLRWLALFVLLATPLRADVAATVQNHILPGYAALTAATATLDAAAQSDCTAKALRPAYQAAFDAWLAVAHLRLGPAEDNGRSLAIAFWPDPKALGAKAQRQLLQAQDPKALDPAAFAETSVAARGFFALERLLYPTENIPESGYTCDLVRATVADLARQTKMIEAGWQADFANTVLTAGASGNPRFLTEIEARQALFTALITGLEFVADQRIGRPLGTFDKPRPERAEARASGRTLRNIILSLAALQQMADTLSPETPATDAAFARVFDIASRLSDATFADLENPQSWLKIDILQQSVRAARDAAIAEVGTALDVGVGFNAADGD